MSQRRRTTRVLVAAIAALLTGSLAGSSGLVLCIGADGHRALEREHETAGCPTLAGSRPEVFVSVAAAEECLDLPAVGSSPVVPAAEAERVPTPPMLVLASWVEPPPRSEAAFPASTDARAGPSRLAPHLRSTVLLV